MARGFTLVEILLVIAVLAIAVLAVSMSYNFGPEAEKTVAETEMRAICEAFQRFYADCRPRDEQLDDICRYGLWPLATRAHPKDQQEEYPPYEPAKAAGWRGPYGVAEGSANIDAARDGQPRLTSGGTSVPVFMNPSGNPYRVMAPKDVGGVYMVNRMLLISLGRLADDERIWDEKNRRWTQVDIEQRERDLLADLQQKIDQRLRAPADIVRAMEELAAECPSYVFMWLLPGRAQQP